MRPALAGENEAAPPEWWKSVRVGGLFYLSYQDGRAGGSDYSKFVIKRGHIDVLADPLPYLSARFTSDAKQDPDDDMTVRIKYAFGRFHQNRLGPITEPFLEFGQVQLPWIYFEESIYRYRMQDGTFMDRLGLTQSADRGVTIGGWLGGTMPETYRQRVNPRLPGRYGSFAFGIYNGGGFKQQENNDKKVWQGRLTLRPMPGLLPGLQLSGFATSGEGNTTAAPDWKLAAAMISYETRSLVLTAQRLSHTGNPLGTDVGEDGRSLEGEGWSLFAEAKLDPRWSVLTRRDAYDPTRGELKDSWRRWIFGVARHLGHNNHILVDWETKESSVPETPSDDRLQLTLQLAL